ncbi:MAG TPA: bifunctional DNA-formamidopyrimidine glycosylase/DNA-(apurinic or apyrimidinic site) lyase [Gaiellaceae bacterium]|nr:bifunctional DNA-formamidopyrimidine glycosylase/DNA-(apurinic or apyrimidinic site) lyase [Gaiellaceae bacterium]
MPELPEVETVRRALAPVLEGRTFARVEIEDPRLVRPHEPLEVAAELEGERVRTVDRRGKYLLVRFESGRTLVVHLRMTGSVLHEPGEGLLHRRARVELDDGTCFVYRDVRRFGTWELVEPGELEPYLAERLGVEPLGRFTAAALGERLAGRRAPVKAALLDQRTVAGLGNIYVDEALWYARLHPLRTAGSLEGDELRRLHRGIRRALALGIARQGSTLSDYRLPDGSEGTMQREFRAYGRTGEPCDRCGTELAKTRVAGRGTWFCPRCQTPTEAL